MPKEIYNNTDFSGGINGIDSLRDVEDTQVVYAKSVSFDEKLKPNKKYWYTFRSIDTHNNLSYPTEVYQVEIVDDTSSIYPLVSVVDFKAEDLKTPAKPLKRFMHVMPSLQHRLMTNETETTIESSGGLNGVPDSFNAESLKLGLAGDDKKLWGKKFKIRLTSKKTGRKIDINVEFENKHIDDSS